VLIAGRGLQGLGAAFVSPAALSVLTTTFEEGAERTRALGVWSAIAAGGGAVGLILGGALTEYLSWRWVFFVNLPVGVFATIAALRFVPNSRAEQRIESYDAAGAVTVTGGLLVLVYAIVKAQAYGWGSAKTVLLFVAAIVLLAVFVAIEQRSRAPLIRLGIFRLRSLTGSNGAMLVVAAGLFAMFYFASLYLQQILRYTPLKAGFAFVRVVTYVGLALGTAGLLYFARLPTHGTYARDILPTIAVTSIGMGLTFVPLTLLATTNVEAEDAGLASGLLNTSQQVGGSLGLAILSTLAASRTSHLLNHGVTSVAVRASAYTRGYHVAFAVGAGMLALGAAIVASTVRRQDAEAIDAGHASQPAA
jgi:MFS family permease